MFRARVFLGLLAPVLASPALAADLPAPAALLPSAPVFTWTGFYVGVNGGFGGGLVTTKQLLFSPPAAPFGPEVQTVNAGLPFGDFFAGGQAGFNYQFGNRVVVGIETDLQGSALKLKASAAYDHQFNGGGGNFENYLVGEGRFGQDWYGTTRLRLGYAVTDRFLAYVTGGLAYSKFVSSLSWMTGATAGVGPTSITGGLNSGIRIGGAVGAGVEYALTQNLTFKTEYLYTRYGGLTTPFQLSHVPAFGNSAIGPLVQDAGGIHVIRAGLNWNFGPMGLASANAPFAPPLFTSAPGLVNWTGFYVGVNGGYGGGLIDGRSRQLQDAGGGVTEIQSINTRLGFGNFFGGAQAGYNFQLPNNVVVGIETDFQGSAIKLRGSANYTDAGGGSTNTVGGAADFGQEWFGTTRVRLGYAVGNVLPYVTGGVAYSSLVGSFNYATSTLGFGVTSSTSAAGSDVKVGFAAGAGLEYAISPNWTVKTEYLYTHYSGLQMRGSGFLNTFGAGPEIVAVQARDLGISIVRAGVNYKFDTGLPPVVARY